VTGGIVGFKPLKLNEQPKEIQNKTAMHMAIPLSSLQIICIVGFSGTGKTTTVVRLINELRNYGLRVGTIKHDAHGFEMDHPGKDSWLHKQVQKQRS
jgi:ABC-type methionine transport system ATPase subunit